MENNKVWAVTRYHYFKINYIIWTPLGIKIAIFFKTEKPDILREYWWFPWKCIRLSGEVVSVDMTDSSQQNNVPLVPSLNPNGYLLEHYLKISDNTRPMFVLC